MQAFGSQLPVFTAMTVSDHMASSLHNPNVNDCTPDYFMIQAKYNKSYEVR